MATVLVRGCGDVGSAVAHVLNRAGHVVALQDGPRPAHPRRGMAFVDALFDGVAHLEGVLGKRPRSLGDLGRMLQCRRAIPVLDESFENVLSSMRPEVLVDARMRKRARPEAQRGLAQLTIGLGPNFVAADNVDLVVETAWGDDLGEVRGRGAARSLSGDPKAILGHSRDRFAHAPCAGTFRTRHVIGQRVEAGEEVGLLDGLTVRAPLSGVIRGLVHDSACVVEQAKIVEVDPRNEDAVIRGLGERPKRIAEGVLRAIRENGLGD